MSNKHVARAQRRLSQVLADLPDQQREPLAARALAGEPGPADQAPAEDDTSAGDGAAAEHGAAAEDGSATPGGVLATLSGAAAFDPGRRGIRALTAVAVMVALVAAGVAWWSRPRPEPLAPQLAAATPGPGPTAPAELVVAVSGMVREPGLVRLPPGARVADALDAAGGVLPDADLTHLNLARRLTDGELIVVGVPPPAGEPGGAPGAGAGQKVNLNTAGLAELETLPGIGPALAQRIIDFRTEHGPFSSVEQLRQVSGIGEVRFAELRDLVTV